MGADKIIEKILGDAAAQADEIITTAERDAERRRSEGEKALERRMGEILKNAEAEAQENERRSMLTASLDCRKNSLNSRREVLDEAFKQALQQLVELPDAEYAALVAKLVLQGSETGREKLLVPQGHAQRYQKPWINEGGKKITLLAYLNNALAAAGKPAGLTLADGFAAFSGGVMLCGELTDVDCSFESLIDEMRETRETQVAALLFGSGV